MQSSCIIPVHCCLEIISSLSPLDDIVGAFTGWNDGPQVGQWRLGHHWTSRGGQGANNQWGRRQRQGQCGWGLWDNVVQLHHVWLDWRFDGWTGVVPEV